jgi:hypothetical protein
MEGVAGNALEASPLFVSATRFAAKEASMDLVHRMIERVRGNGRDRVIAEAVRRCAAELARGLTLDVHSMPASQRAGYVRAHARAIVAREARRHGNLHGAAEMVLDGVVARVLADLSTAPRMPVRRAA